MIDVEVECQPGHLGESEPRRFRLGSRGVTAVEILDRWPAQDHRYFKLRGDDGALYILRHDKNTGRWELYVYERPE